MQGVLQTIEVRNARWPEGAGVVPPGQTDDAYWRDVEKRPYALAELLAGADEPSRIILQTKHIGAISRLLAASLEADHQGCSDKARAIRHRARRLIGEMDGWWVEQAREVREGR